MSQNPVESIISTINNEKSEVTLGVKRSADEASIEVLPEDKPKLSLLNSYTNKEKRKREKVVGTQVHISNELYINLVSEIMYPKQLLDGFGYGKDNIPIERLNLLGYITNPLRQRTPMEKWSPYEISIFESCITLYGKNFSLIQKYVETKSVKEVIEFYYDWKKTSHYKDWKKNYVLDERDLI